MRIGLLCAAARGRRVLEHLLATRPDDELLVGSFRETPGEPPFLDEIRALATARACPFVEAKRLDAPRYDAWTGGAPLDLMLVVGWRYLLPLEVCERPRRGTFVFHDSLLPAYRGFSPTVWAMVNGESEGGVTLFRAVEEVDAGPVVDREAVRIGDDDVAGVMERVTRGCLAILDRSLGALLEGRAVLEEQDATAASFTCRRLPEDDEIDWRASTRRVRDLVRAVTRPYPGAWTRLGERRLRIWAAERLDPAPDYRGRIPGRVVEVRPGVGAVVLTGDGVLLVTEASLDGEPPVEASRLLSSTRLTLGRKPEDAS